MSDISTSRLRELLNEATTGPWSYDERIGEILGAPYHEHSLVKIPSITFAHGWNADLIALAPELAEEVIRLRKAIETSAEISETRADNCHASRQLVAAAGHRATARHLRSILEGDKP